MLSDATDSLPELDAVDGLLAEFEACGRQTERLLGDLWEEWDGALALESEGAPPAETAGAAESEVAAATEAYRQQMQQLESRLEENQRQQTGLEQERALMEVELEGLRQRAAEMSDMLGQQKELLAQQQRQWSDELQPMRRLLEQLSERITEVEESRRFTAAPAAAVPVATPAAASAGAVPAAAVSTAAAAASPAAMADPVLDSVMAQFEMLQKDMTRRRGGRADLKAR